MRFTNETTNRVLRTSPNTTSQNFLREKLTLVYILCLRVCTKDTYNGYADHEFVDTTIKKPNDRESMGK